MLDERGKTISPRFTATIAPQVQSDDELEARARTLLSGEKTAADPSDVLRQLEFALKNKLKVQLTIELPGGSEENFLLTPLGLGAGRLRGRDEERQAERTLPVSRIKSVVLS
jgi:predicted DNA-binding transcriptional regulator YafY